jgi:signal transduction histidine kinase
MNEVVGGDTTAEEKVMTKLDPKELLRPVFPGLEEEDLAELASVAELHTYPANTVLCREGEIEDIFYLIVKGYADVTKYVDEETPRRLLHRLGPGDFFGEIALVEKGPRSARVDTGGPITVLEIHRDAYMRVLTRSAPMAIRMVLQVTSRLRDADQQAIAALRRKNEELRRAYHHLEQLDKAKADFISVVGHELRTPLTVVSGYANMLKTDAKVREDNSLYTFAEGIAAGMDRFHGIINSILDVSRLDNAVLEMRRVPVAVAVLIKEIESSFELALQKRRMQFETDGLSALPFILADGELLYKAFYHLIVNAIKYTPDGGRITISGEVTQNGAGEDVIQVVVADTGIGIDVEHHELIFEKFYQIGEVMLHSSGVTKFKGGGPGLGLAIAKGAIAAHGGDIWVESLGHDEENLPGSRFYVQIPLNQWQETADQS